MEKCIACGRIVLNQIVFGLCLKCWNDPEPDETVDLVLPLCRRCNAVHVGRDGDI